MIRSLYSKIFIGINIDLDVCQINIIRLKNDKIKQNIKTEFKIIDDAFPIAAYKLIHFYQKKYPLTFIGMMSKTTSQGVIPSVDLQDFTQYAINTNQVRAIPFFDRWSAYIDKQECANLARQIPEIGTLDYLFSPFILIFLQARKRAGLAIYALQERGSISIVICDDASIYYGKTFFHDKNSYEYRTMPESILSLESLLKNIDHDIDSIDLSNLDPQWDHDEEEDAKKIEDLNDFVRATFIAEVLEQAIGEYYKNSQSAFIDKIIIFDSYGMTSEAIGYIQETLMIETIRQPISLPKEITSLMIQEFNKGES